MDGWVGERGGGLAAPGLSLYLSAAIGLLVTDGLIDGMRSVETRRRD